MDNETIVGLLVFGILSFVARRGLHTSGKYNNALHWGLLISGIILFGTGLTFALPVWFPTIFNFQ